VKLLSQFATAKQRTDLGQPEVERRHAFLRAHVSPGVEIEVAVPAHGPGSIESRAEALYAVPAILDSTQRAEALGYDAIVFSCYSDPGLDAARELVSIPVVGSGQASMHVAAQLGAKFSILAPRDGGGSKAGDNPWKYGFVRQYASTRGCGLSVMDLGRDRAGALSRLADTGRACIEEDGADVLILGCMSMAFHDITSLLQERLDVPVINPVLASLAFAELCVRAGLSHSKRAYPTPPKLEML
jgi:allantoin racemase